MFGLLEPQVTPQFPALSAFLKAIRECGVGPDTLPLLLSNRPPGDAAKAVNRLTPTLRAAAEETLAALLVNRADFVPIDAVTVQDGIVRVCVRRWSSINDHAALHTALVQYFERHEPHTDIVILRGAAAPMSPRPWTQRFGTLGWLVSAGTGESTGRLLSELVTDAPPDLVARFLDGEKALASTPNEYSALLMSPFIVFRSDYTGATSRLVRRLVSNIALHNLITVNQLHPSMTWDLRNLGFCGEGSGPNWPPALQEEWRSLSAAAGGYIDSLAMRPELGGEPPLEGPNPVYELSAFDPVVFVERDPWPRFPILVLPSLFPEADADTLVDTARRLHTPGLGTMNDRLAHALDMWTEAWRHLSNKTFHFFDDLNSGEWILAQPDLAGTYSAVVLEALFSDKSDSGAVTQRIADRAAALLGRSGDERLAIARRAKQFYAVRSDFVHGRRERTPDHDSVTVWGFLLATCALASSIRVAAEQLASGASGAEKWEMFDSRLDRMKYGD